jgi:tetratricopeptide (TPR) repeat protein
MELVEGKPLSSVVGKRRFKGKTAASIMAKVAEAIHAAHEQGIIHRDIKPSNILIAKGDEPRVMDFGLAKEAGGRGDVLAKKGISGTPEYMSPEQASGSKNLDRRTDVYALGAVLYALLTGKAPYSGKTAQETVEAAAKGEPQAPREVNPSVPAELQAICLKAMAKEREDRYPSAGAMAEDLTAFLKEEVVSAAPPTLFGGLAKKAKRNPLLTASLGFVALAVLAAIMVIVGGIGGGNGEKDDGEDGTGDPVREGREARAEWEKAYREARADLLSKIDEMKKQVQSLIDRAYVEMDQNPNQALATLRDANTLLLEVDDRVMPTAPKEYEERLSNDRRVRKAAQAKEKVANIAKARASALGARAWGVWERALDLERARGDYDQAVAIPNCDFMVYAGRGLMFREASLWKEAFEDLARAVKKSPTLLSSTDILKSFLDAGIRSGRGADMEEYIDRLPEDTGDRPFYRGLQRFQAGDGASAQKAYQEALKKNSLHTRARIGLAEVLKGKGELQKAAASIDGVIEQLRRVLLSRRKGRTFRDDMLAQADLIEALVFSGSLKTERARGASGGDRMRMQSEARSDFEEALRINPSETRARAGLKLLGG